MRLPPQLAGLTSPDPEPGAFDCFERRLPLVVALVPCAAALQD